MHRGLEVYTVSKCEGGYLSPSDKQFIKQNSVEKFLIFKTLNDCQVRLKVDN